MRCSDRVEGCDGTILSCIAMCPIPLTSLERQGGFIVGEGNLKARSFVDCLTNSGHYRLNRTYCSNEIIRVSVRLPARVAVFYDDNETTLLYQRREGSKNLNDIFKDNSLSLHEDREISLH